MKTSFFFASPEGDIPADEVILGHPFLLSPTKSHPSLTLGDYFKALQWFLLESPSEPLLKALRQRAGSRVSHGDIQEIRILSEKHGAFYHVSRIKVLLGQRWDTFALVAAISPIGKDSLRREFEILEMLNAFFCCSYLPEVFTWGEVSVPKQVPFETWGMLLQEWFADYHEWHLLPGDGNKQCLVLWDLQRGYRQLEGETVLQVFRQTAKILTLYYDIRAFRQIHPWHHGAGDFVVRERDGIVDVKLTTVRGYDALGNFGQPGEDHLLTALVFFFLGLTLKIRIDKRDGTGEPVFAGRDVLKGVVEGFLEALRIKEREGLYPLGNPEELAALLKSFSEKEIITLMDAVLEIQTPEDPADLALLRTNLEGHAADVYRSIQTIP
jgi:hypothetical protein